jgi:hypothetical protein
MESISLIDGHRHDGSPMQGNNAKLHHLRLS